MHKKVGIHLCQFGQYINGGVFGCALTTCRVFDIDATPDPLSLSLSFVQAWGRVGGRYFLISTANSSVNKWGINKVLCIIYFELTNSTSFGGFSVTKGDAQIPCKVTSFGASIEWAQKGLENGLQITSL